MRFYDCASHAETPREEAANAITHGLGLLMAITALVWMCARAATEGQTLQLITLTVFGAAMVAMYLASTLFHSFPKCRRRRVIQIFDHACIYVLIAGTYTPFMLVTLGGVWGWTLFGVAWGMATCGVVLKIAYTQRFPLLSTGMYVAMGWVVVLCWPCFAEAASNAGLGWLLWGGMAYTAGVVFYLWQHLPFNHAIWHLFVVAGSACHVVAAFYDVLPA